MIEVVHFRVLLPLGETWLRRTRPLERVLEHENSMRAHAVSPVKVHIVSASPKRTASL